MKNIKKLSLISAVALAIFSLTACDDDSSVSPNDLTYTNEDGESVSIEIQSGSFKDSRNGATYSTVVVDGVAWMAENLRYIEKGTAGMISSKDVGASSDFGVLYAYQTALSVCPSGWHLPTREEWQKLIDAVSKTYGFSVGWALKSKKGWNPDGEKDGNGGDVIGFSVKAGGLSNGYYAGEGEHAAFWTYSKKDRDDYVYALRFDYDSDGWSFKEFYALRAMLYVRCVSDKGTPFENIGECSAATEGNVFSKNGGYRTCKSGFWESSTHDEILDFELGICDSTIADSVRVFNDTAYTCKSDYSYSGNWTVSTMTEALGPCTLENNKEFKKFQGVEYVCYEYMNMWRIPKAADVLGTCNEEIEYKVEMFNDTAYICKNSQDKLFWQKASEEEIAKDNLPACTESDRGKVESTKAGGFVCVNKYWRRLNIVEENLGVCNKSGATGVFGGFTFTCNAEHMLWRATLNGDTALVAVDSMLWMTRDVYGGQYAYSPLAKGGTSCPAGFSMPTGENWNLLDQELKANRQVQELLAHQDSSYYGLNLYKDDYDSDIHYFLANYNVKASDGEYLLTNTRTISSKNNGVGVGYGSVWICSVEDARTMGEFCGSARIRCIKDYSTSKDSTEQ